jgi:hypothetical protein
LLAKLLFGQDFAVDIIFFASCDAGFGKKILRRLVQRQDVQSAMP